MHFYDLSVQTYNDGTSAYIQLIILGSAGVFTQYMTVVQNNTTWCIHTVHESRTEQRYIKTQTSSTHRTVLNVKSIAALVF